MKTLKKQIISLFLLAILIAIASIIHGIFFDLAFEEIKRLTISGIIFTLIVVFPFLLVIERIFDMNNEKKFQELERRIKKLEKKND
jgi:hypothetical protein